MSSHELNEGHSSNNDSGNSADNVQIRVNYHRRKRASTALVTSRILKAGLATAFSYAAISQAFFLKQWASQNPRSNTMNDDDTPQDFFWQDGDTPDIGGAALPKEIKFFEGSTVPILGNTSPTAPPTTDDVDAAAASSISPTLRKNKQWTKAKPTNHATGGDTASKTAKLTTASRRLRARSSRNDTTVEPSKKQASTSNVMHSVPIEKNHTKTLYKIPKNVSSPWLQGLPKNETPSLKLLPRDKVQFVDKFSDSWLIPKERFLEINVSAIDFVEQACFQIMVRKDAQMTVDWTDFMVEHLSKWWSEFRVTVDMDSRMFDHSIHILSAYLDKRTKELKASKTVQNNGEQVKDDSSKSPLHPTLAIIAYQTYPSVFREREKLLSPFSLAATLVSLLQVGFGRIVIVGYKEDDWKHAKGALELVATRIPGSVLAVDDPNKNTTLADVEYPVTSLSLTVGHTEIAYVRIPSESWVKTKNYKINMPKGALHGLQAAIKGNLTKSIHNTSVEEWLGTTHDGNYWKYFYLTEPDTILHTKKHLLPHIRDGLDKGTMYMPHRLQPLPHEYNLPPAKVDAKEEERTRGNKHLSKRYKGRFLPGDVHPFSNITFLDPWNNKDDHCCDAGKFWPGRDKKEFGDQKQFPCDNWWWACGFEVESTNITGADTIRESHKRLLPYPMMSLDSGTGIVFGPAEQGRRCFPSKEPCSLYFE